VTIYELLDVTEGLDPPAPRTETRKRKG
jgi:hypothetical protein